VAAPRITPDGVEPKGVDFTDLSLEDLGNVKVLTVYGASKHEQRVSEAPSAVTIVTRDEIQKSGYQTLGDILNSAPGLDVHSDRNFSLLGIRGFGRPGDFNTKFQTLLDGHRLNDGVTDRAALDYGFPLDIDLIERVEIIRGPGSSLYGDSAFFGVVNVIPRRGKEIAGAEVSTQAGSFDSYQGRFSYGTTLTNGVEFTLSGTLLQRQGHDSLYYPEFDTPESNDGIADHVDREKAGSLFASAAWNEFTVQLGYVDHTKQVPTASYGTVFNSQLNSTRETRLFADLKYEHKFEHDLELTARLGYDRGTELGTYIYDNGNPVYTTNIDDFYSQRTTADLQLRRTFLDRHALTLGTQLVGNPDQDQKNHDLDPLVTHFKDKRRSLNYAFFLQDEYQIFSNLILNAGVRYDHFESFGSTVNPRLALIYQVNTNTTLKFLY
jgi:iron complex outermembrane receptor protein